MGSRGSVIPFFINKRDSGATELPITDMRMTRFNISLEAGVALVMYAIGHHLGGEIFIPKIPSYRIKDIATAIAPNLPQVEVGIRPGEKLHEEMITVTDALDTIDLAGITSSFPLYPISTIVRRISSITMQCPCPTAFTTAATTM